MLGLVMLMTGALGLAGAPAGSEAPRVAVEAAAPAPPVMSRPGDAPTRTSFTVAWESPGAASYDVSYRRARWNGSFGASVLWKSGTTAQRSRFSAKPGFTYCFWSQARDASGNVSHRSADRCAAVPLDDPALTASRGWKRAKASGFYRRTYSASSTRGARLTRSGIRAKRLFLVATLRPRAGTVRVRWKGRAIADVALASATTRRRALIPLAEFPAVRSGKLTITVTSPRRGVQIDGLAVDGSVPGEAPAVVAAAGDIACDPGDPGFNGGNGTTTRCKQKATSNLLVNSGLDAVLALGDIQYEDATHAQFMASYDPSWGRVKSITRPVAGNHEYETGTAAGYFQYFGSAAGDPAKGYYSFDLGDWHVVALNSDCWRVGGCKPGDPQNDWLRSDLAARPSRCTLAYWHYPRFSSGPEGNDPAVKPLWDALYEAGVDVVLNGHEHLYERFALQTPGGQSDPKRGIRQFTVGTGGKNLYSFAGRRPNSQVRNASAFGVLRLTLYPTSYEWRFVPIAGKTFTDRGATDCR